MCRRENRYALVAFEREQIRVAGDNGISLGDKRAGKHLIVVGVARDRMREGNRGYASDECRIAVKQIGSTQAALCKLAGKFGTTQYAFQLS